VRFVGDASTRIREDYLRILRLFRFHAWYGKGELDADALAASTALKGGLAQLSGERIQKELLRLLEAENPVPVLRVMADTKILADIIPATRGLDVLERLVAMGVRDPLLRLATLLPQDYTSIVAARLKLSNAQTAKLENLLGSDPIPTEEKEARKILYRIGPADFADRVHFSQAQDNTDRDALLDLTVPPKFPLTGKDAMAAGLSEGPVLGYVLANVEQHWIETNFTENRDQLLVRLKKAVAAELK
jgi:poly(A) polymerase